MEKNCETNDVSVKRHGLVTMKMCHEIIHVSGILTAEKWVCSANEFEERLCTYVHSMQKQLQLVKYVDFILLFITSPFILICFDVHRIFEQVEIQRCQC